MDSNKQRYPEWWRRVYIKGQFYTQLTRGQVVAKKWPKPFGPARSPAQQKARDDFAKLARATKQSWAIDQVGSRLIAANTQYIWRDVLSLGLIGKLVDIVRLTEDAIDTMDVQQLLDQITTQPGTIIMRAPTMWVALVNVSSLPTIVWDPVSEMPVWGDAPITAITQLTGDVHAGPGVGSQVATLQPSGVTPGLYTLPTLLIDAKGRVLTASSGSVSPGLDQLTGDVTAGPGSGSQAATLANTAVSPGSYTLAGFTVDSKGRLTAASSGSVSPGLNQLTGDVTAGPGTGSQAATLANTAVSPGSYTLAGFTVDSKGRLTAASSGSVSPGLNQLTGDVTAGPGSGSQAATLANTAVTPASYVTPLLTVDSKGRITAATDVGYGTAGRVLTSNGSPNAPTYQAISTSAITAAGAATRLNSAVTPVGIIANTSEQVLQTYTMPGNTLAVTGSYIVVRAAGRVGANSNQKTIRIYFGSVSFQALTLSSLQDKFDVELVILRTGANTQQMTQRYMFGSNTAQGGGGIGGNSGAETDTANIVIKVSGQSNAATANNVICDFMTVTLQS